MIHVIFSSIKEHWILGEMNPIKEEEVEISISKPKIGKTACREQVAPEFIKYGGDVLLELKLKLIHML